MLALCYYQLSERTQALEYLSKAKAGTMDPKQRQKTLAASRDLHHRRERSFRK